MTKTARSRTPARKSSSPRREPPPPRATAGLEGGFPLGKTGRTHPPLGLGLWALGRWRPEDEARTKATIGHALERGIRWFDTAEVYGAGRSERILGDVFYRAGAAATEALVVTKLSWEHLRAAQVRPSLMGSLQRLGRSTMDLYLVHSPDPRVPVGETMGALEALWKEGKIGAIGVSNFSVEQLTEARAALHETDIVVNQVLYNLFERADGDEVLPYCRKEGILVEAYTPLARGLLAGRYLSGTVPVGPARSSGLRERLPEVQAMARQLHELATEARVPMASLALHWLAHRGVAPLFGASQPNQVDEVLAAWAARPTEAVLARAEAIARGHAD
ncbi:MAG TPA: aldo/keto reductase [Thermoplasmata archaeon]|nr:aldo/keto reductase [Thermoplasmata archaeon]